MFKRFSRWCRFGVWEAPHQGCVYLPDLQAVFIDATINRAHVCAAGAAGSNAGAEALGRSRGGFSTKAHAQALLGLASEEAEALGGDKGFDGDALIAAIKARDMAAVIPPKANRTELRECDWDAYDAYRECHAIDVSSAKSSTTAASSPVWTSLRVTIGDSFVACLP